MSHFQTYLELAVQEREQYYVYDEGFKETWEDLKSFASEIINFTAKKYTVPALKELSPKLKKLKEDFNDYVFNLQNEYEEKVQSTLDSSGVKLEKNKKRRWWNSSLFTEKEVLDKLTKQKNEQLVPLKELIKQKELEVKKLVSKTAKAKRQAVIEETQKKVEEVQTKYKELSQRVIKLFEERNELFKEKQKATEEQKEEINKKIESNAVTITKVVASFWVILSLVANYVMLRLTGLAL